MVQSVFKLNYKIPLGMYMWKGHNSNYRYKLPITIWSILCQEQIHEWNTKFSFMISISVPFFLLLKHLGNLKGNKKFDHFLWFPLLVFRYHTDPPSDLENCSNYVLKTNIIFMSFTQRTACYIQVFALSRWLAVTLPVEYYELARGIQWSIPYLNLPWETKHPKQVMAGSGGPGSPYPYVSKFHSLENFRSNLPEKPNLIKAAPVYGLPLTPMEYSLYFEVKDLFFFFSFFSVSLSCSEILMLCNLFFQCTYACRTQIWNQKQNIWT